MNSGCWRRWLRAATRRGLTWGMVVLVLLLTKTTASTQDLRSVDFLLLVTKDQGELAVQILSQVAAERGGWQPSPGDTVVFDPHLPPFKRASTVAVDLPPTDCESPDRADRIHPDCRRDYQREQNLLRFGIYTFVDDAPEATGAYVRRPLDDILSVYIEEAGHSWQEYCYETEGRCQGKRTRITTWGEGSTRAAGWEYQIKMYILSLNGNLLSLSAAEQRELVSAICDGYANPIFSPVEGEAPPGWPNPEGWPVRKPTLDEFANFCLNANSDTCSPCFP